MKEKITKFLFLAAAVVVGALVASALLARSALVRKAVNGGTSA